MIEIANIYKQNDKIDICLSVVLNLILWRSAISRLFSYGNENLTSFIVEAIIVGSLVTYAILFFANGIKPSLTKQFQILLLCFAVILTTVILSYNEFSVNYFRKFCLYVFLPTLFLIEIKNVKLFLWIYVFFAVALFVLLAWEPILGKNVFMDSYMAYGFELMAPCFCALYLLDRKMKIFLSKIPFILCFILSFLFANRSCCLGMLTFVIFYEFFVQKGAAKKAIFIVFLTVIFVLVYINLDSILSFFLNLIRMLNVQSYSLTKLIKLLNYFDMDRFTSNRNYLYETAFSLVQNQFPFPFGIGKFELLMKGYCHNIILDFLLNWGGAGLIMLIVIFFIIANSFLREKSRNLKILKLLFISLWFPKLFFSTYFICDFPFFASLVLAFRYADVNYSYE